MKLTLREARRLERAIETQINVTLAEGVKLGPVAISVFQNFEDTITGLNVSAIRAFEVADRLSTLRYDIRRKIQRSHEANGLNDLMAEEAMLKNKLAILGKLGRNEFTPAESAIAQQRFTALAKRVSEGSATPEYGQNVDTMTLSTVVSKSTKDAVALTRKATEKRLRQIIDESAKANSFTTIEVLDSDIEFIEGLGLVV